MIFVIGGTGRMGLALLQRLAELDGPVRALAHSPAAEPRSRGSGPKQSTVTLTSPTRSNPP